MSPCELAQRADAALAGLASTIVGKEKVLRLLLAALLADGHVLIEDVPGVAKTTIAASLATLLGLSFRRVQFTPDLLPADLTGSFLYDQRSQSFSFHRGPIFTQILLADEINRAAPKTQSALLEAMQERQVTVEGESFPLGPPFLVIATQNPIEFEGTYALPEAELDRFVVQLRVGYPEAEDEARILRLRRERQSARSHFVQVLNSAEFLLMQVALEDVFVDPSIENYIVQLVRATREDQRLALGASPRASLALMAMARAVAGIEGRSFVIPDDVKRVAVPVLAHRLVLKPENWGGRINAAQVVESVLSRVQAPAAEVR